MNRIVIFRLGKIASVRFYSKKQDSESSIGLKEGIRLDPKKEVFGQMPLPPEVSTKKIENVSRISGMPADYLKHRVARIYRRSKNVMQQGTHNTKDWILEFETKERWENPLMGWASSGDSLSNVFMEFPSACAAICFAEKQGLRWVHEKPPAKKPVKKSYSEIFSWNKRTRASTK